MKCELCNRENLSAMELAMHRKHFHRVGTPKELIQQTGVVTMTSDSCPDCGGQLQFEEGCRHCPACGYSKCG